MSEYETILKQIRPFGPFQIRIFVLVSLFETPLAWAMLVPIFTAANPGFSCSFDAPDNFGSEEGVANDSTCSRNGTKCTSLTFDSDFTSVVTEWQLVCDEKYVGELITSVQMGGVLVGAFVTGQLADIFGRKKILFIEYALLLVVWLSTAFATSWQMYAVLRCIVGGLIGGCLVVNFVLPMEFVTPAWRTFCGCVGFWAVGLMTLSPWAYFLRDWRTLNIAMASASVVLLPLWWFIDESPRWLLSRGRINEANKIIIKAAKFNNRPSPKIDLLQAFIKREKIQNDERKKYSYQHLLCSSYSLTARTLICVYGWFVCSAVYYGLNFNSKNLAGDRYLNVFISGLVEIPALLFVLFINNRWGRRATSCFFMLGAGGGCISILILDLQGKLEEWHELTLALAMIGKSCIAGAWVVVQIFSAETFPTVIRNIGIGSCSMGARIGGIVAPQFVYLGEYAKPLPFTIFGALALTCCVPLLMMTETVGQALPDRIPGAQSPDYTDPSPLDENELLVVSHDQEKQPNGDHGGSGDGSDISLKQDSVAQGHAI